jgi:hypothetical protein
MKRFLKKAFVGWMAAAGLLQGQTQVDLRTQSKAVDFRTASSTKPVKSGPDLPATCDEAEMFFLTTAPAGLNLYGCSATNTWTLEAGPGGVGTPGGLNTQCQFNDNGAFGGNSGCTYNKTTKVLTATGGMRSGDGTTSSGLILPELAANGSHYFAIYGAASQTVDGCIIVSGSPATSGDVLAYTGTTANTTEAAPKTCKVMQWATPPGGLTGSAVIDFPSLANGQCASNTYTLTGVTAGARVAAGYPAGLESGLVGQMKASAANTISVQLCNLSGATLDPASGTFSAAVL